MALNKMNWKDYKDKRKALSIQEKNRVESNENLARVITDLYELRCSMGISQRKLAEMTGLKQPAIARMEKIETIPRLDTITKVANALGYSLIPVNKEKNEPQITVVIEHDCSNCAILRTASQFYINQTMEVYQ